MNLNNASGDPKEVVQNLINVMLEYKIMPVYHLLVLPEKETCPESPNVRLVNSSLNLRSLWNDLGPIQRSVSVLGEKAVICMMVSGGPVIGTNPIKAVFPNNSLHAPDWQNGIFLDYCDSYSCQTVSEKREFLQTLLNPEYLTSEEMEMIKKVSFFEVDNR